MFMDEPRNKQRNKLAIEFDCTAMLLLTISCIAINAKYINVLSYLMSICMCISHQSIMEILYAYSYIVYLI